MTADTEHSSDSAVGTVHLVTHATQFGGAERVLLLTASLLNERGIKAVVGCPPGRLLERARNAGVPTLELAYVPMHSKLRPRDAYSYWGVARAVRNTLEPSLTSGDLLHVFSPVAGLFVLRMARRAGTPLIFHVHDAQRPKTLRRLALRLIARRAQHVICASRTVEESLAAVGITRRTSVLTVPVDESFLMQYPPRPSVERSGPVVAMFGQLVPWKGQEVFLAAAARVADELPEARFLVVGDTLDDSPTSRAYRQKLHLEASLPALDGRVSFVNFESDVATLMSKVDIVVHASTEQEAFGLVIAEAVSLGKTVVASDVGGPREIRNIAGGGVALYPAGDVAALAALITEGASGTAHPMTVETRCRAKRAFSPETYVERLLRIYAAVVPARGH